MEAIQDYLHKLSYFADLDAAQLDEIARLTVVRRLARGEIVALEGEPCTAAYFVVEGRVRAFKTSPQGREQVVSEIQPGEAFYLVPALDNHPLPVTTEAATRLTLLSLAREDFLRILQFYPPVALATLRDLAQRLRHFSLLIEDLALRSVSERLAKLLLAHATSSDERRMTQREMAAQLGTVREVVARTLAQFEMQGWIRLERGSITIIDAEALRQAASLEQM